MTTPLYRELASLIDAAMRCARPDANSSQREWGPRHRARADALVREYLPSGSGFDNGTKLNHEQSHGNCLIFVSDFHKIDENGFYCGWTGPFPVIVRPDLQSGISVEVRGLDKRDEDALGDYIHETFMGSLMFGIEPVKFYLDKGI